MKREQGGDNRVRSEISRLARAIKFAAAAGASFVTTAAPCIGEMWAAIVDERQDRVVIKQHASMPGAATSLALDARQRYHERRTNSAAIAAWWLVESAVSGERLMTESIDALALGA